MPFESRDVDFYRTEEDFTVEPSQALISENEVIRSLSFNMAWDHLNRMWRKIASDPFGRQRVTSGVALTSNIIAVTVAVFINTDTLVLDVNPKRQMAYIENLGSSPMRVGFRLGDTVSASAFTTWPNDHLLVLDGYQGQLFLNSTFGTQVVQIWDF